MHALPDDSDYVELSDAIGVLREQLLEAHLSADGDSPISFDVGKVEIEFSVEMKTAAGARGGVKFLVVNADAKIDHTRGRTQKLKVELIPTGRDGEPIPVAARSSVGPPPS